MRGLFSRLGGASPKAQAAPLPAQQDVELPKLLSKTGELLKQLRDSSSEDFPLLNEATRHSKFGPQYHMQLLLLVQSLCHCWGLQGYILTKYRICSATP